MDITLKYEEYQRLLSRIDGLNLQIKLLEDSTKINERIYEEAQSLATEWRKPNDKKISEQADYIVQIEKANKYWYQYYLEVSRYNDKSFIYRLFHRVKDNF